MALIKSYKGLSPRWGKDCYFSENATLVGDVTLGDQCSVWFNAVVRGDVAPITIGDRTNVQDGSCIHVTHETGPTHIGSDVTIGHNVTVHACFVAATPLWRCTPQASARPSADRELKV